MIVKEKTVSKNIYFGAGKTKLYTDFDGTFMPFLHNDVCNNNELSQNSHKILQFNTMYSKFDEFCKKTQEKFNFIITTGRNKHEFDFFINKIKQQNLKFILPEKLITTDGGDSFDKSASNEFELSKNKIVHLAKTSNGWNKDKILVDLKQIINKKDSRIIIIDSSANKHQYDYEDLSLEYNINKSNAKDKRYYASFVKDSELSLDIAFPNNMDISEIETAFKDYFEEQNLKVKIKKYEPDLGSIIPEYNESGTYHLMPAKVLSIKPMINENTSLTKLYDAKQKVSENIKDKTDDLVIVAGDGSNDESMLNIFNYLDLYGMKVAKNTDYDELIENEEVLTKLIELPLVSIIVGQDKNLDHLRKIGEKLDQKGIHKIISVIDPKSDFLNSIKQGMLNYSEVNNKYKHSLGYDLFCELLERDMK